MEKSAKKEVKVMTLIKILFVSYIITGILLLILALLLYKLDLGENQVNIGVIAIYLISCFAGGFIAGKRTGSRKFLWNGGRRSIFCDSDDHNPCAESYAAGGDREFLYHIGSVYGRRNTGRNAELTISRTVLCFT